MLVFIYNLMKGKKHFLKWTAVLVETDTSTRCHPDGVNENFTKVDHN